MEITVDLYKRLSLDLAAAIGLSSVHAPELRDRLLKTADELDDAFNEADHASGGLLSEPPDVIHR